MSQSKVAVVLGVGPGLGSAVAHRFAREGFAVGLMARNSQQLSQIQSEIEQSGAKALSVTVDASDPASVKAAFEEVSSQLGAPEVFVYNAGAFQRAGILELTPEQFESCWKVNCFGAFLAVQQVLPAMVERRRGTILLTGATAAVRGSAKFAALAVGKFGLRALAQSLAREFCPQGIHVAHIIIDGMINTPRVRAMASDAEEDTLLAPEAIAQTYWQLYQQDATAWTLELDLRPAVEKF
ncbi:SDR family NAD(P)-dependent oxidoreductase [Brasilonema bromeliae]|uniref:Short-chain dehydrogenase n=1 Tax=Brasilonema bromeliae SPC951 TaxID=385972 RepID=A0ABX1PAE7_9CYAN|nr:SDR family NAD(P)-dependent oxidoreductase [Brasilonema bromeliae]NMG20596.1 short-chain dehydrogenase [Brasilonema bromeliae SPC951]